MTIFEEKQYDAYMDNGNRMLDMAENYYEEKSLEKASKAYYHAAMNFECAKELARAYGKCDLTINAKDKEFYCLEKIDELATFKNTNLDDLCK